VDGVPSTLKLVRGSAYYHDESESVWIYVKSSEDDYGVRYHFSDLLDPAKEMKSQRSWVADSLVPFTEMDVLAWASR
jgi:hypothetical protein